MIEQILELKEKIKGLEDGFALHDWDYDDVIDAYSFNDQIDEAKAKLHELLVRYA